MTTNETTSPIKIEINDLDKEALAKVWADISECLVAPETVSLATYRAALAKKGFALEVSKDDEMTGWIFRRLPEH